MTSDRMPPSHGPVREESHNAQINTAAAQSHRCGMTHLASGRICLLPERHSGSCEFRERQGELHPDDLEA